MFGREKFGEDGGGRGMRTLEKLQNSWNSKAKALVHPDPPTLSKSIEVINPPPEPNESTPQLTLLPLLQLDDANHTQTEFEFEFEFEPSEGGRGGGRGDA